MEKVKCTYPGCKEEHKGTLFLVLVDKKDSSVNLPFCKYHCYIVMGGHFKAKTKKEEDKNIFELVGPLKEVEISEQVYSAIEMIKKLKEKK